MFILHQALQMVQLVQTEMTVIWVLEQVGAADKGSGRLRGMRPEGQGRHDDDSRF